MRIFANKNRRRDDRYSRVVAAGLMLAVVLIGCSAAPPPVSAAQVPSSRVGVEPPLTVAESSAAVRIHSVNISEAPTGSLVEVDTSGTLVWTTYRDHDGNLVVELPNSAPTSSVSSLAPDSGLIEAVTIEVENGERPLTRLVVKTRAEAEHSVVAEGTRLRVELKALDGEWAAAEAELVAEQPVVEEAEIAASGLESEVDEPIAAESYTVEESEESLVEAEEYAAESHTEEAYAEQEPTYAERGFDVESYTGLTETHGLATGEPDGVAATQLHGIEVSGGEGATVVQVLGDGEFYYSTFALQAPERFVVDLIGVVNASSIGMIPVDSYPVERVRVAQFKPQPELVSRVVIDLSSPARAEIERRPDGLSLRFAALETTTLVEDLSASFANQAVEQSPVDEPVAEETADLSWASDEGEVYEPAPLYGELEVEGMGSVEEGVVGTHDLSDVASVAQIEAASPELEMEPPTYEAEPAEFQVAQQDFEMAQMATEPIADQPMTAAVSEVEISETSATSSGTTRIFTAQTIGQAARTYEGEPMTMSLRDADIKDVLRSFAQISGLNVVVQPGVSGTVTVELTNVPWDQALEQILKINGLDYQLEGNIMRVAPISKLREEAEEQQRLREAQALSIPLTTIMKRVSYADARDMARILSGRGGGSSIMSQRGSVVVDARTNTLIIKELPSFLDSVIAVIENLDTPEPQVTIEARIIETTKRFSRSLGIAWGFSGVADPAHGNTTGLEFPAQGTVDGAVSLLTGGANAFLDISLGNVLNTFTLDAVLQAAESDGLINVLSAPSITTLNNQQASIQSGLQIPIQTVANNTVSVQFVNATLRLDVTPHVTAEGTVIMDINIQKREPQLAFAVVGATNAPIATKDARTRVIVRDGGTTVIAGLYEVSTDVGEDRVPGLANIPILKHLFRNKRRSDENEELLIFITPRVVKL